MACRPAARDLHEARPQSTSSTVSVEGSRLSVMRLPRLRRTQAVRGMRTESARAPCPRATSSRSRKRPKLDRCPRLYPCQLVGDSPRRGNHLLATLMAQSFAPFYRGKRVLVTGHTGFTGGWLVAWLKLLGAKVCG